MSLPSKATPTWPLKPPQSRAALLSLWYELAPRVQQSDPLRHRCVLQALEQNLPFQVLVAYVHRECVRALEEQGSGLRVSGSG
jgi:hypothetical protein